MTLPAGTISISQVNTELGAASTRTINMDNGTLRTLAGVSTASGATYSMSSFHGKSAAVASALDKNSLAGMPDLYASSGTTTATARVTFYTDGTWQTFATGRGTVSGRWQSGTDGANYEVMYTGNTGFISMAGVARGVYAPINTTRIATLSGTNASGSSENVTFAIRKISNQSDNYTWDVYMEAYGACFAVGTMLRTPQGDMKVEDILAGQLVNSFAEPTMVDESIEGWEEWCVDNLDLVDTTTTATIKDVSPFVRNHSIKLNGIHSTLSHRHFVWCAEENAFCWKMASEVTMADSFVDSDKNLIPITDIEEVTDVPTTFIVLNAETLDTLQVKFGDKYLLTHNVSA